ncbi:MAG: aquaporin [Blastocatellia bacterium]|nr:aquaporin [Blastocatellia bacterium]
MNRKLKTHWPEYMMEGAELAAFMISACAFGALLEHPASPLRQAIPDALARRGMMGMAMGLTAIVIIHSPWGKQSGAHFNPSVTLTFWRLGKIAGADAAFYILAQFCGAMIGVMTAILLLRDAVGHPSVNYVATQPGARGLAVAFAAETAISFLQMTMVLNVSNRKKIARYTGLFAGGLVATWIVVEAPLSGMSMNPARTLGSALPAQALQALWIYFTAPPLGMLLAAELHLRRHGAHAILCAKLHHENHLRCIFRCNYGAPANAPHKEEEAMT